MYRVLKLFWPFEGNCKADVAPSENEFDTPDLHYAAERQKELLHFVTAWVELESIMLSEISQAVKDKYYMISPINLT